jgi:hypothetical protein
MSGNVIMIVLFAVLVVLVIAFALWYCFLSNSSSKTAILVSDAVIILLCVVGIVFCVMARSTYKEESTETINPGKIDEGKIENIVESPLTGPQEQSNTEAPAVDGQSVSDNTAVADDITVGNFEETEDDDDNDDDFEEDGSGITIFSGTDGDDDFDSADSVE